MLRLCALTSISLRLCALSQKSTRALCAGAVLNEDGLRSDGAALLMKDRGAARRQEGSFSVPMKSGRLVSVS